MILLNQVRRWYTDPMSELRRWRLILPPLLIGAIVSATATWVWGRGFLPESALPKIIAQWSPVVSMLTCNFRNRDGGGALRADGA